MPILKGVTPDSEGVKFGQPAARLWMASYWVFLGILVSTAVGTVLVTNGHTVSASRPVAVSVGLLVSAIGAAYSYPRISLFINDWGIEVHNFIRSYRVPWSEIEEIGIKYVGEVSDVSHHIPKLWLSGRTPPGMGLRLKDGRQLPAAQASISLWEPQREALVAELTKNAKRHGIKMTLTADDLL